MLVLPLLWLLTAVGVYIAALRSGMTALRWAAAALISGPLLIPLFNSHKRLLLRKVQGGNTVWFRP
ncbi:hypothetical protein [Rheinheimera gaetbuli]